MRTFWRKIFSGKARKPAPDLSVIIPFFASHDRLEACLQSIATHCSLSHEILLVDDGNQDFDFTAACAVAGLSLIRLPQNQGVGAARNAGIAAAQGRYCLFLDSDDELTGDPAAYFAHLSAGGSTAIGQDCGTGTAPDIITGHLAGDDGAGSQLPPRLTRLADDVAVIKTVCFTAHLYRTAFLHAHQISFPTDTASGEDTVFLARALPRARDILETPVAVYRYRERDGSLSRQPVTYTQFHQRFGVAAQHIARALSPYPAAAAVKGSVIFKYAVLQLKAHPALSGGDQRDAAYQTVAALYEAFDLGTPLAAKVRDSVPVYWDAAWDALSSCLDGGAADAFFGVLDQTTLRLTRWG